MSYNHADPSKAGRVQYNLISMQGQVSGTSPHAWDSQQLGAAPLQASMHAMPHIAGRGWCRPSHQMTVASQLACPIAHSSGAHLYSPSCMQDPTLQFVLGAGLHRLRARLQLQQHGPTGRPASCRRLPGPLRRRSMQPRPKKLPLQQLLHKHGPMQSSRSLCWDNHSLS